MVLVPAVPIRMTSSLGQVLSSTRSVLWSRGWRRSGSGIHIIQIHDPAEDGVAVGDVLVLVLLPLVPDHIVEGAAGVGGVGGLAGEVIPVVLQPVKAFDDLAISGSRIPTRS